MRRLRLKYDGECRKCGTELKAGTEGIYERRVGVFCVLCGPTDPEEIRTYRQEGADRKADRYEEWAGKRREKAAGTLQNNRRYWDDWAFVTQPGRIPMRSRIIAQDDRAYESLQVARRMEAKAESLRDVRVAGDTERARQIQREVNDERFKKGDRIFTALHGAGEIVGVFKKSYRVNHDRGYTCSVDKSWARPA
jgi:hypothetical protein